MSIEMRIVFEEQIDSNKLDELIDELKNETMNFDEKLGEMRTFADVGQAMGDPLAQILIAVTAHLLAAYIENRSPTARRYTSNMLRSTFNKVKRLTNKAKIVIKKEGKELISLTQGTDEEINKTLDALESVSG